MKSILKIKIHDVPFYFKAICNHLRAVEYYAESLAVNTFIKIAQIGFLFQNFRRIPFEAVLCSRFAEFNFFFDKVKFGKLQCTQSSNTKVIMGYQLSPETPSGNYYLTTNSEFWYSIGENGTKAYLDGVAPAENFGFH